MPFRGLTAAAVGMRRTGSGGGGGGGSPTFESTTSWSRPAFTPTRTVPFTTQTGLTNALTNMQAGDLITYAGTSGVPLNITSSSGVPYSITGKHPASTVVIDFGVSRSIWIPGSVGNDYVKFSFTGTGGTNAFTLRDCSNLQIYGGDFTTGIGGVGVIVLGPITNVLWYDAAVHDVGLSGWGFRPITSSGASSVITGFDLRSEVDRFAMNPALDTHPDRGTGCQGCNLHGSSGSVNGSRFVVYGHDPLRPGETSAGNTWPEGGGGDVIEPGNDAIADYSNLTLYAKGVNMLMQPNGTNPGSAGHQQIAGNVIEPWGANPLTNCVIGWVEGINCTGANVYGAPGSWSNANITVLHGRSTNMNQFVGGNQTWATPYDSRWGISYSTDCL